MTVYLNLLPTSILQGLIYAFVALGIMLPFRIVAFADLTAEGAFSFGGSVTAALIARGIEPILASAVGMMAGACAGAATALIHLGLRLNTLLCGILVLTMLFSIDIRIMGKPNIALFAYGEIFSTILGSSGNELWPRIAVVAALAIVVTAVLYWFLCTEIGMALRAVGASRSMARAQGISVSRYTILGLALAGSLSALGGVLVVQNQSFADVNMGLGILVNGLASLIVGEQIIGRGTLARQVAAPVVGALVYFQLVSVALSIGFEPSDLKLFTGLIVLILLAIPALRGRDTLAREGG